MALRKNLTLNAFNRDIEIQNAYIKVVRVEGTKEALYCTLSISDGETAIQQQSFQFAPSITDGAANFIAQAYEHLKTLPEFDGAADC